MVVKLFFTIFSEKKCSKLFLAIAMQIVYNVVNILFKECKQLWQN